MAGLVFRIFRSLAVLGVCSLCASVARAQTAALLAATEPTRIAEVDVAKAMASDASLWLSVRLSGRTRLAVVAAQSAIEPASAADAWLRALDFATRMRVAPPPGPLASCGESRDWKLADSGLPESASIVASHVENPESELELRKTLADAGLAVDLDRIAAFTRDAPAPYRVSLYDGPANGGSTVALRLTESGYAADAPHISVMGLDSIPLSLIALARSAVLPAEADSADPSEFPVAYRAAMETTDYVAARASFVQGNPGRWLSEVQASSGLFAWTVFPSRGQIAPVATRYFQALSGGRGSVCEAQVQAAYARGSVNTADFVCSGSDDLAETLRELGFGDVRLSRLFGSLHQDGAAFRLVSSDPTSPVLEATDFDVSDCAPPVTGTGTTPAPGPSSPAPVYVPPYDEGDPGYMSYDPAPNSDRGEGSCVAVFDASDSCSGDPTPSEPTSSDSCSGDSSSDDSNSSDSCSGDSSSDDSGPDSCSGDSSSSDSSDSCSGDSDSSSDDSGCGKSEYDGDTCSGSSKSSANDGAQQMTSAALGGSRASHRPRRVRLSLLTLLAAALALPLRRLRASR